MPKCLWTPSKKWLKEANLTAFMEVLSKKYQVSFASYHDLHAWSVQNKALFWQEIWSFSGVLSSKKHSSVLTEGAHMLEARWFEGALLNYAQNLLEHRGSEKAILYRSETKDERHLSFDDLRHQVACVASFLKEQGVGIGDRVAAFIPNIPEAIVAMLATSSIGAIWSSCSPDFGVQGVVDRFSQIQPKVLFTVNAYSYNGKVQNIQEKVEEIHRLLPSVETVVTIENIDLPSTVGTSYTSILQPTPPPLRFAQLPFHHPLYILYSSGTTGMPKCIVHSAGGTLLQHLKELSLHCDVKKGDRVFYHTTCGWMMWNWLVSALALGATVCLFDGSPFYPTPNTLWNYAEHFKLSHFGTSAKYLSALENTKVRPFHSHDLDELRVLCSTGSPLLPEQFSFVYSEIKEDLLLASITGGTDIVSLFAGCCPLLPVYAGEIQCACLGMDVAIYDDEGTAVLNQEGELVCQSPFPCMPVGFWNDPEGEKYFSAYFTQYENIWCHGDWAKITPQGGLLMYGRSDATLNPGGVRIGTAEIYRQVESFPEVIESVAVGQDVEGDSRIVLFVVLRDDVEWTTLLESALKIRIREECSPRHVPALIHPVKEIPKTRNGKIMELAVRAIIHGRTVKNLEALANPQALKEFQQFSVMQTT